MTPLLCCVPQPFVQLKCEFKEIVSILPSGQCLTIVNMPFKAARVDEMLWLKVRSISIGPTLHGLDSPPLKA